MRVERAWLLLGLDVVAATKGSSMGWCGCHALFGSVSTSNQPVHNALSGTDDEHDSDRAGEDGATMVHPISQDADAPFQGANLPFYNRAAAPS